jgi:hypothetical protein
MNPPSAENAMHLPAADAPQGTPRYPSLGPGTSRFYEILAVGEHVRGEYRRSES